MLDTNIYMQSPKYRSVDRTSLDKEIRDIRAIKLFSQLKTSDLLLIKKHSQIKQFTRGQIIYHENRPASKMYLVSSGKIKLVRTVDYDKEIIKSIVYPNETFGELSILPNEYWSHFAEVISDATLYVITQENLQKLLNKIPELETIISTTIIDKFKQEQRRLECAIFDNSRARIISFLKEISEKIGRPIGSEILIKHQLTHNEIAKSVYTSRQTVTETLNELKNADLIHLERGTILIRNLSELR